jgi:NADH dehydrogenase
MPFAVWKALAAAAEVLPGVPLTRNQVELMREDNVTRTGMRGLGELGIKPMDIDQVIRMIERPK